MASIAAWRPWRQPGDPSGAEHPSLPAPGTQAPEADRARERGDFAEAARLYDLHLTAKPHDVDALLHAAYVNERLRGYRAAESLYLRALDARPDAPEPALLLGHFYRSIGWRAKAERCYRDACARAPDWRAPADALADLPDVGPDLSALSLDEVALYDEVRASGLFDAAFYASRNGDVEAEFPDLLEHFVRFGLYENRAPNAYFDSAWYAERYPEVGADALPPFLHYLRVGAAADDLPGPRFDPVWYRHAHADLEHATGLLLGHFLRYGRHEARSTTARGEGLTEQEADLYDEIERSGLFDPDFYLEQHSDVGRTGTEPLKHFVKYGLGELRDPNRCFDTLWYQTTYADVLDGELPPFLHYLRVGMGEDLQPGPDFDPQWYRQRNPDVHKSGQGLLFHYLRFGSREGRVGAASQLKPKVFTQVTDQAIACLKLPVKTAEMALFVSHSPAGVLKPHVEHYLLSLANQDIGVVLIVQSDVTFTSLPDGLSKRLNGVFIRENGGYDFAAWAHVLRLHPEIYSADRLFLLNDSLFGPTNEADFADFLHRLRRQPADVVGVTETYERTWHIQSYFLLLNRTALANRALQYFFRNVVSYADKDDVIDEYECKLAPQMVLNGLTAGALVKGDPERINNPSLYGWKDLLEGGFPFLKVMLARDNFDRIDKSTWRQSLIERGYPIDLADAALSTLGKAATPVRRLEEFGLTGPGLAPVVRPGMRIAFFGPWNYDNGLAQASRGYITALRQLDAELNLSPIKTTFHIHKPIAPAFDINDFVGPADVAVVHLNPDGWPMLDADQRRAVDRATIRIGLWVWETSDVPHYWYPVFDEVDAIWTPSSYCAAVIRKKARVPVYVVPHVVTAGDDRDASASAPDLRRSLGIPDRDRIFLYMFDGSSYLARKNPFALIEAFERSGLGREGWTLVLKTKHLFDSPGQGLLLQQQVAAAARVKLVDASMSKTGVAALMHAADVYVSPHRSEGFGLTIAEAMSLGKVVVATDYSGSTDFLDEHTGFPVPCEEVGLDRDFGHYLKGSRWADVDVEALTHALRDSAACVERGDGAIGAAAARRIAALLSPEAVGRAIEASVTELLARRTRDAGFSWKAVMADRRFLTRRSLVAGGRLNMDVLRALRLERHAWLVWCPEGTVLNQEIRHELLSHGDRLPGFDLFYWDEAIIGADPGADELVRKPEFDFELQAATGFAGECIAIRACALEKIFRDGDDIDALSAFELILRADAAGVGIGRITAVLTALHAPRPRLSRERRSALLADSLRVREAGLSVLPGRTPTSLQLRRRFDDHPHVTLVIPTMQSPVPGEPGAIHIVRLLKSLARSSWPADRMHVLIGDDIADDAAYADLDLPFSVRRVPTGRAPGEPFNYAAKMNRLWRLAETDDIVLMNDDMTIVTSDWLEALMTFSTQTDVGGAGARLVFPDGTLQHAGIVGGLHDFVVHAWFQAAPGAKSYEDWADVHRRWSMVTGAVFATRKSALETVGGFDEALTLEFNDVDLCLRLRTSGFHIVYTPFAELVHYERASRGDRLPPAGELARFLERWTSFVERDPCFHPAFRRDTYDVVPVWPPTRWWRQ